MYRRKSKPAETTAANTDTTDTTTNNTSLQPAPDPNTSTTGQQNQPSTNSSTITVATLDTLLSRLRCGTVLTEVVFDNVVGGTEVITISSPR